MMQRDHRSFTPSPRSRCGFTLLELMIALMTLGAIVVIFAGSVVMAEKTAHVNGQYAQAISLCQHKIDQARAFGFGKLNHYEMEDFIVDSYPTSSPYSFAEIDNVGNYLPNAVTSMSVDPYPGNSDIVTVTVSITWRNVKHKTKTSTASLSALIANVE